MEAPRQIRVSVHGTFQYAVRIPAGETIEDAVQRMAINMKIEHLPRQISVGQVNFGRP